MSGESAPPAWRQELRTRWGLAALTALGVLFLVRSAFTDWLSVRVRVDELRDDTVRQGVAGFGAPGVGFLAGSLVLLALLGLALRASGRARVGLSLAAVALALLLLADLAWVGLSVLAAQHQTAREMVALRDSMEGLPVHFEFSSTTPGLFYGASAVVLLALVAAQLPAPRQGPRVQAWLGTALGVAATPLPWTRGWVLTADGYRVEQAGLWSIAPDGVVTLVALVALIALAYGTLRAAPHRQHLWAIGAGVLAVWSFFSAVLSQLETEADVYASGAAEGAVFALQATDASALLAFGAVLLGVAAARAWWHGREEVPSGAGEGRWLPGALEGALRG